MARPRAATYDGQQAAILSAAAGLFARKGYTATTMSAVAAASGVGKGTLYHYFADKAALLEQIALSHVRRLERLVDEVRSLELPASEHLEALIRHFMVAYSDAQNEHRVLTEDVRFLGERARRTVEDGERRVVQAYVSAVAAVRPDLAQELHRPLAMLLFGMINWTFTWLKPGGALSHGQLGEVVIALLAGGLPAVAAGPPMQRGEEGAAGDRQGAAQGAFGSGWPR